MAGKRPKGRPEPLGGLLQSSLNGTSLGDRLKDLAVWRHWEQVVGPAIARRARPLRLSGGVLTVVVASAPWMQQLSFMKAELTQRLNTCLGEERVREIVLRSGQVKPETVTDETVQPVARPLSPLELDWIEQQVREIPDDELREQFRALMTEHYRFSSAG